MYLIYKSRFIIPTYYICLKEVFREAEHPNEDSLKIMINWRLLILQLLLYRTFL